MRNAKLLIVCLSMLFGLTARAADPTGSSAPAPSAVASVQPLGAGTAKGTVRFTQLEHGVQIQAEITGLTPGTHGFHIHEFGDCSAADGSSAGGHFNPEGKTHGGPNSPASHAGDYGNLEADAGGSAALTLVSHRITLDQSATGVLGRSVIVHEKTDDLASQPAGNAGPRIGCGVIMLLGAPTTPILKK
jgi:superoxide dismutase, Cu-Zn family